MAINGFTLAQGEVDVIERIPSSAFSRGDVVMLDSSSSVSRWDAAGGGDILGVALAPSVDSVRDRVPIAIPRSSSVWRSDVTPGTSLGVGDEVDIEETSEGRSIVASSTNTARVVVVQGVEDADERLGLSVQSTALVRFMYNADELELS